MPVATAAADGAGGAKPLDHAFVGGGHVVGMQQGAVGGAQALRRIQILDADREAMQRRQRRTLADRRLGCLGLGPRARHIHGDDGVDRAVDRLDARKAAFQKFHR
jgi:hypothetical protein